jgi:hypothetical protein
MHLDEDQLVSVGVAPSQMVAEMWRDLLLQEGIPTIIQTSGGYAYLGALTPCTLLAAREQAEHARDTLAPVQALDADDDQEQRS